MKYVSSKQNAVLNCFSYSTSLTHLVFSKTNRKSYAIRPEEIIPWLKELCEKTGGYNRDWRCLEAEVKDCDGWTLKYIRFVRNDKQPDEFIVCNSYLTPIKWKEVIPNLRKDVL